jgi:hypothetical protein
MLRSMLRVCVWHVASSRACNIHHHESFFPPPPCCDYIATVLRATFNIRSSPPLSPPTRIPTSHACNIETQHP